MSPKEVERIRTEGLAMLHFCIQVAEFQLAHNRSFLIEQPATASSLSTHSVKWLLDQAGVWLLRMDQCAAGLSVVDGKLSKKPTAMITNHLGMVYHLARLLCDGSHIHQQLQGGLPAKAQEFPEGLVKALLEGIRWAREHDFHGFNGPTSLEDEEEQLGEEEGEAAELSSAFPTPAPQTPSPARATRTGVTNKQKDLLYKLHVNTGHLPVPQMLAMLKAAGARDEIREYVKNEFHCLQCMKQHRPVSHRRSTFPKSFSFNKLVGIDFFYISFLGKTHAFLNVICLGTNLQQVALLPNYGGGPPNARDAWNLFSRLWLQPFGLPETLICDQGSEFKGLFERSLEQVGVFQAVIDGAAPWQNGKTERHGAWIKARLEDEIQSGQTIVQSSQELELLAQLVTCHKNRWFHRGGFSPYQLVFGVNPRIPLELLSDDQMVVPGIADAAVDPFEADGPAAEFARAHQIRQKARELCIASNLKDKVRLSLSQQLHQQKQWSPGQWVYVWRKFPGTGEGHTTRSRWVGPGLVILQQSGSVWVSMRARIWKCSSDQLRSASHLETLGAELSKSEGLSDILSQTRSKQAGAVDVAAEGPPDPEAWDQPTEPRHESNPAITTPQPPNPSTPSVLPPIPEAQPTHAPNHGLIRQVLPEPLEAPAPNTPVQRIPRQVSQMTQEEPQIEPLPSTSSDESEPKKRRVLPGTPEPHVSVRKRVADTEAKRLEREALKELRRLDREDRQQRRTQPTAAASSSAPATAASDEQASIVSEVEDELLGSSEADADLLSFFEMSPQDSDKSFMAKPAKSKNSEFNMKLATPEERKGFEASDAQEWSAILEMQSVRVLSKEESQQVHANSPERIITSRMIRRKKPMPGLGNFKYKSRWCLHGHQDTDTGTFEIFAPMPSTEAITMFFQISLNESLRLGFLDIKNAFCQADKLNRPRGKIYAIPCEGIGVEKGRLIEIIAPIYGLDDSPLRWHLTLIKFFESLGFVRSLLEPCWMIKRSGGKIMAQVLIEVDDLNIATVPEYLDTLQAALKQRFIFGKWEHDTADFAGRHVSAKPDKIIMHQEKYILEKLHPIKLAKGRFSERSSSLTEEEFETFRSSLYKVNWVGHQTRPEAAGIVSILASRLKNATVHDVSCLNKLISHLRSTANQLLILHKFDSSKMIFIAASDAGGVDGKPIGELNELQDTVQGAWVILAADRVPSASSKTRVSILSWRSAKLKRRVTSTLASEALAFSQALGELEWLQVMFRDVMHGDINKTDWTLSILPFVGILKEDSALCSKSKGERLEQCTIVDAKSLYDSLKKENPNSRQDRRTSIEVAIIIESMQRSGSVLRWSPHPRMIADVLTKDDIGKSNGALEELFKTGTLALWDESDELARRKLTPRNKARSKKASLEFRAECAELLVGCQLNSFLGVLSNCSTNPYAFDVLS